MGRLLAEQGDFGHALYAIEAGTASVSADGGLLRDLGPGDIFGEIAVLTSGRRTSSVVATSPMRLIVLFKRDVWRLERSSPTAAARLRLADRITAGGAVLTTAGWLADANLVSVGIEHREGAHAEIRERKRRERRRLAGGGPPLLVDAVDVIGVDPAAARCSRVDERSEEMELAARRTR